MQQGLLMCLPVNTRFLCLVDHTLDWAVVLLQVTKAVFPLPLEMSQGTPREARGAALPTFPQGLGKEAEPVS